MKLAWTPEEDAVVRDIYSAGKAIKCHLHRLPGRSYDSVKTRAHRLGVRKHESKPWSKAESRILKKIWTADGNLKAASRQLPGRTYNAILTQAARVGIPAGKHGNDKYMSWVDELIVDFLEKGGAFTAEEIAEHTKASIRQVRAMLKRGKNKKYHIDSWRIIGPARVMVWAHGKEPDEKRPAAKSKSEECKAWRAKQTRKEKNNPFAVLMSQIGASTVIEIDNSERGRVYQQSMKLSDFDEELEAA